MFQDSLNEISTNLSCFLILQSVFFLFIFIFFLLLFVTKKKRFSLFEHWAFVKIRCVMKTGKVNLKQFFFYVPQSFNNPNFGLKVSLGLCICKNIWYIKKIWNRTFWKTLFYFSIILLSRYFTITIPLTINIWRSTIYCRQYQVGNIEIFL